MSGAEMWLVVRATAGGGDPSGLTTAIRRIVAETDRTVAVSDVRTMSAVVDRSLSTTRFTTVLVASFATLALLFGLTRLALGLLLQSQADNTVRVAVFLADVVISPLLFLGAAIVYVDLAARVGLSRKERRRLREAALGRPK